MVFWINSVTCFHSVHCLRPFTIIYLSGFEKKKKKLAVFECGIIADVQIASKASSEQTIEDIWESRQLLANIYKM